MSALKRKKCDGIKKETSGKKIPRVVSIFTVEKQLKRLCYKSLINLARSIELDFKGEKLLKSDFISKFTKHISIENINLDTISLMIEQFIEEDKNRIKKIESDKKYIADIGIQIENSLGIQGALIQGWKDGGVNLFFGIIKFCMGCSNCAIDPCKCTYVKKNIILTSGENDLSKVLPNHFKTLKSIKETRIHTRKDIPLGDGFFNPSDLIVDTSRNFDFHTHRSYFRDSCPIEYYKSEEFKNYIHWTIYAMGVYYGKYCSIELSLPMTIVLNLFKDWPVDLLDIINKYI
jgi:hypothetical protein